MIQFLKSILAPIISLFILMIGSGFLMTLVPIRAELEGFSPEISGYLASVFFAGILIGSIKINKVIEGVGHIRAFAFFASTMAILTLLQGLFVNPAVWILFRFLYGLCMAGIFISIESWLLVKSSMKMRGIALSIYMTIFYSAQSLGQLFLGVFDPQSLYPFCFIAILGSLSVLPLTITRIIPPIIEEQSVLSPKKLFKISPIAVIGALFSGLILGPIYGLLPIYAQKLEFSTDHISWIMGGVIFGGLAFQWPIGALSDKMDRRKVLLISSIVVSVLALIVCLFPIMSYSKFLIFSIFLGGFCFVLYPLSVSHACDIVDAQDIVAATGAVLLSYGTGSILGPIVASYGMRIFGPTAFFVFLFVTAVTLSLLTVLRVFLKKQVPEEEKLTYSNIPQTTPMASELDPRIEEGIEKEEE